MMTNMTTNIHMPEDNAASAETVSTNSDHYPRTYGILRLCLDGQPSHSANATIFTQSPRAAHLAAAALNDDIEALADLLRQEGYVVEELEPEPESYDDAFGRRCDAEASLERDLIGAGRGHLVAR